ncbi:ParB N-terminal domain-containing protein [Bacteroides stercoris]|uniref:ParB N-terminal domain-containing protein n=1 Tax=Bacteroides stercoris TaxID=46506 RepID=UPI0034A1C1BF
MGKSIEVVEIPLSELKDDIGNPRKITKKKAKELQQSLEQFGDFGIIVIDEHNNIISGHQRVNALKANKGENETVLCKKLIGYSETELRAINIKANTHAGDWDMDKLADWTADFNLNLGFELPQTDPNTDIKIKDMELIRYEKYDYVMIVCRNEIDYLNLTRVLGIDGKKVLVAKGKNGERKIKARAIWYDEMKAKIVDAK